MPIYKQTYIKDVRLSGYKSIKNVTCEFEEGLNIIIGNNGSGKSNLLEFIYQILAREYNGLGLFKASISIDGLEELFNWNAESKVSVDVNGLKHQKIAISEPDKEKTFLIEFVKFNLPNEIGILSHELNSKFDLEQKWLTWDFNDDAIPQSVLFWLTSFFFDAKKEKIEFEKISDEELHALLNASFNISFDLLRKRLNTYTPIEDVRISRSVRITNIDASTLEFRNIILEYKINNEWFPWNALSDGTKRLVYLIFKIDGIEIPLPSGSIRGAFPITLLEEPELGIHPHQLHLLLDFLKEKSKEQQIIITTHSPQVLDILGSDELNKIIIAEIDYENGTVLRHLNEEEIKKARFYFKDQGLLSDYWRFSDFQRSSKIK